MLLNIPSSSISQKNTLETQIAYYLAFSFLLRWRIIQQCNQKQIVKAYMMLSHMHADVLCRFQSKSIHFPIICFLSFMIGSSFVLKFIVVVVQVLFAIIAHGITFQYITIISLGLIGTGFMQISYLYSIELHQRVGWLSKEQRESWQNNLSTQMDLAILKCTLDLKNNKIQLEFTNETGRESFKIKQNEDFTSFLRSTKVLEKDLKQQNNMEQFFYKYMIDYKQESSLNQEIQFTYNAQLYRCKYFVVIEKKLNLVMVIQRLQEQEKIIEQEKRMNLLQQQFLASIQDIQYHMSNILQMSKSNKNLSKNIMFHQILMDTYNVQILMNQFKFTQTEFYLRDLIGYVQTVFKQILNVQFSQNFTWNFKMHSCYKQIVQLLLVGITQMFDENDQSAQINLNINQESNNILSFNIQRINLSQQISKLNKFQILAMNLIVNKLGPHNQIKFFFQQDNKYLAFELYINLDLLEL